MLKEKNKKKVKIIGIIAIIIATIFLTIFLVKTIALYSNGIFPLINQERRPSDNENLQGVINLFVFFFASCIFLPIVFSLGYIIIGLIVTLVITIKSINNTKQIEAKDENYSNNENSIKKQGENDGNN